MSTQHVMSVTAFRELGLLQEINRRLLHPLGLALSVTVHEDGAEELGPIWDHRDDPEGCSYGDLDAGNTSKAVRIDALWKAREPERRARLGYMVQPLGGAA